MQEFPSKATQAEAEHVLDIESDAVDRDIAHRMYNTKLNALRAQHPFVKIGLFPNKVMSVVVTPNTPLDVNLPTGVKMIRFNADGIFFVSRNGRAQLPAVADNMGNVTDGGGAFFPAFDTYYYVEEIPQISLVSDLQVRVTIECIAQI
jgi:hypothetical protein